MPTNRRGALRLTLGAVHRLLSVSTLTALATGLVHHDQAPQDTVNDYVLIQAPVGTNWDSMQNPGEDIYFQVACVTFKPDSGPAMAMLEVVKQLVDGERPSIANHLCVALQWKDQRVLPDDVVNGKPGWRAVATFRALVDQTS